MRLRRPLRREVIGQSECPILHRWTLLDRGSWKLMDRDYHDHPRPYLDIAVVAVGEYSTQINPVRARLSVRGADPRTGGAMSDQPEITSRGPAIGGCACVPTATACVD